VATYLTGLPLTTGVTGTLGIGNGGTGISTTPTNGQIAIGNGTNYTLATLTAGSGISITNGSGSINIASTVTPANYVAVAGSTMTGALNLPANGLIAGTSQLVLSSGNVGIGTSSPVASLHVAGATTIFGAGEASATPSAATVRGANAAGTDKFGASLNIQASNGTGTGGSGAINFLTAVAASTGTTANTLATAMTVSPNGSVGIGSTSPSATLDLRTTSAASQFHMITALQPSLPVSGITYIDLGTAASNNDQGALYFRNVGAGSANNTMSIGFYGTGDRLAVLAGGNVGIGTTSPAGMLHIAGATTVIGTGEATATPGAATIRGANASGTNKFGASLILQASNGTGTGGSGAIYFQTAPVGGTGSTANTLATAVTITSAGNVGIGTTVARNALEVYSTNTWSYITMAKSNGKYWYTGLDSADAYNVYNSSGVGAYMTWGATSWTANSDIRIKKNFAPLTDALEKVAKLRGFTYHYKTDDDSDPRRVGVIAQDVQAVLPEAITVRDGILGVKYTEIIPLLIEAIKDIRTRLFQFEQTSDSLDERLTYYKTLSDRAEAELQKVKMETESLRANYISLKAESAEKDKQIRQIKDYICGQSAKSDLCH